MAASLSPRLASSLSSPKLKCRGFSICLISSPPRSNLHFSNSIPQLGICKISTWNGLRQLDLPKSRFIVKLGRKRRCKGVYASLFGVGAPEALVIGVVALLVFGPKGLAEVARNLGKTLRDFQPTIRELQEVSRDFKSTLEREIGLDEIQETNKPATRTRPTANPEDIVKANTPGESLGGEDAKISEEQVEASVSELPVTDGSVLSKESETQEYLKQLEEQVQTLLAEKQKKFAPAATEVKSQDTSSLSTEASFMGDNEKTKEQELEEVAAQQQNETSLPTDSQAEPQSQSEDTSSYSTEASFMEEKLKTKELELEELASQSHDETPLSTESQAEPQSQSEDL